MIFKSVIVLHNQQGEAEHNQQASNPPTKVKYSITARPFRDLP